MAAETVKLIPKSQDVGSTHADRFWKIAHQRSTLSEHERVQSIKSGLAIDWAEAVKSAFQMSSHIMSELLSLSTATYDRRRRDKKPLDITASERLDRIISIALLAENVFEDQDAATQWMATPNRALDGSAPIEHCDTEIGSQHVRRILNALEWGGVV